jgi:predicted GNAT family acetyltransferase
MEMSDDRSKSVSKSKTVSKSRFEFEEEGQVAYLEFETDSDGWMTLWHTEVPPALQGRGIAGNLARTAFEYARDHSLKVDVICPTVANFVSKNPEFRKLIGR